HRDNVCLGLFSHHRDALRAVAQGTEPGNVIRVQMGIDSLHQAQVELADELQIAIDLLQHGVDHQRLAAASAGNEIRVGTRHAVKQLSEDHPCLPPSLRL